VPEARSKAASRATTRSSVWDARFGAGPPLTIGIEEEYMLLDGATLALAGRIDDVLAALPDEPWARQVTPELFEPTAEVATGVLTRVDDAYDELATIRRGLSATLDQLGLRLASAGAHPFSLSEQQRITPRDRYRSLLEQLQYVARRELVFGMHVHVAVPTAQACIHVMEGLLVELPVLMALAANSPFWRGDRTGLASTRTAVFAAFPRSGLPPRFASYDDYADTIGWLEATGAISDYTHIWWDVRPHPRFGTVELRVMDAQFDLAATVAIAAYTQALVASLIDDHEHGRPPASYHRALIEENKWNAARYGVDAQLLDLAAGRRARMPAHQLARRRLRQLKPYARSLDCWDALQDGVEAILQTGGGAARQVRVWDANRDLVEMLGELSDATALRS
jgi:glutamate---cysteine ligase / carboxylate-amine ligase